MSAKTRCFCKLFLSAAIFCVLSAASVVMYGQTESTEDAAWVDDWSHHRLVFSNPGTAEDAMAQGRLDEWLRVTSDPRYKLQQLKRSAAPRPVTATPDFATRWAMFNAANAEALAKAKKNPKDPLKKDWSTGLGGNAATYTGTVATLTGSNISSSSTLAVGGVTFDAGPPTAASAVGTFTGNPTAAQTVTIGGSEVLTATLSTAATGKITVAASYCIGAGQGVTINGVGITTNATAPTGGSVTVAHNGNTGTTTIGGVVYTWESSLATSGCGSTLNCVLVSAQSSTEGHDDSAEALYRAIDNTGASTCSNTGAVNPCYKLATGQGANAEAAATYTANSAVVTIGTWNCAGLAANFPISDTTGQNTLVQPTGGTSGTAGTGVFALPSPVSNTTVGSNMATAIGTDTATDLVTAAAASGVVTLTATTWGTGGNAYTLTQNAVSGVSLTLFSALNTGTNGLNTGTSFAIDNVNNDAATNLAAAITRNGGTVGVTAVAAGAGVTVTATTAGTGGNSISLAETLANFAWVPAGDLTGGLDGTTSGTNTPPTFAYWSGSTYASPSVVASDIATAINANTTLQAAAGVTAAGNVPSTGEITLTANTVGASGNTIAVTPTLFSAFTPTGDLSGGATGTVQPNAYPAKFGASLTTASCSNDFVVYPTGVPGTTSSANIVAYNQLYVGGSGCTTVPSVYWAFNTGGTVTTSPIISYDSTGSQVAFIQVSGTTASLVLIKWAAASGTLAAPVAPTPETSSTYRGCTAPCMLSIPFGNGQNDTYSAPDNDIVNDVIYVGDDNGYLHQFTGVFRGTPAETVSASSPTWPAPLTVGKKVSTPVYDPNTTYVFVGDFGGILYSVYSAGAVGGTLHGKSTSGVVTSLGDVIADAPLVDSYAQTVFAFVTTSGSYSSTGKNAIYQFSTGFTALGTPGVVAIGTGGAGDYLYDGTFDNVYFESTNTTGYIYVVGNTGTAGGATLYQVGVSPNLTGVVTAVASSINTAVKPWPSPATEFCNNGTSACALNPQRTVTGSLKATSPEVTITVGTFTAADVGSVLTGTGITGTSDTIATVLSSTTANLTTAPTTHASETLTVVGGNSTTTGNDYVFFSIDSGLTSLGCTQGAGNGCVLSYNVNDPGSVTQASAGGALNVTSPGTNGCWATGGLVIDNSAASGGSQIYFINLDGNAAGGPTGTTQTSSACTAGAGNINDATQASQSSP